MNDLVWAMSLWKIMKSVQISISLTKKLGKLISNSWCKVFVPFVSNIKCPVHKILKSFVPILSPITEQKHDWVVALVLLFILPLVVISVHQASFMESTLGQWLYTHLLSTYSYYAPGIDLVFIVYFLGKILKSTLQGRNS